MIFFVGFISAIFLFLLCGILLQMCRSIYRKLFTPFKRCELLRSTNIHMAQEKTECAEYVSVYKGSFRLGSDF